MLCSLYSFTLWFCLGGGDIVHTCAEMVGRRGGRDSSSKVPRTVPNMPQNPRCPQSAPLYKQSWAYRSLKSLFALERTFILGAMALLEAKSGAL